MPFLCAVQAATPHLGSQRIKAAQGCNACRCRPGLCPAAAHIERLATDRSLQLLFCLFCPADAHIGRLAHSTCAGKIAARLLHCASRKCNTTGRTAPNWSSTALAEAQPWWQKPD